MRSKISWLMSVSALDALDYAVCGLRKGLRAASTTLAALAVLVLNVFATPSAPAQTLSVLYNFTGQPDGANPYAGPLRDAIGNLYGTTTAGGAYGFGTVFKLDTSGEETLLYSFAGGADGANPYSSGLIQDASSNLYGTTQGGGSGYGVVFKLDTTGNETVLHSFTGGADGANPDPYGRLIKDAKGNLYGTTYGGGSGYGVVFKLDPAGSETVLHSFTGGADGANPEAGLTQDTAGNLYGTTYGGGSGYGVVYKLDPTGKETVLHTFTGETDGRYPSGTLVRDTAGNLYGTTSSGGIIPVCTYYNGRTRFCFYGRGVVFKLDPTGKETVLHSFTGGTDGTFPRGLVMDAAGRLFGATWEGGYGWGVIFELTTAGTCIGLHQFTGGADGAYPAGLMLDAAGNLYGTTDGGGPFGSGGAGHGIVFKLVPGLTTNATVSPTSLTFGTQTVGTTTPAQTATLTNAGSVDITIDSVVAGTVCPTCFGGNQFEETNNCGSSLAPGASCQISVTFTPTTVGMPTGALTITNTATNSPQTIGLSGTGVAPTGP